MKTILTKIAAACVLLPALLLFPGFRPAPTEWIKKSKKGYQVFYTPADKPNLRTFNAFFRNGIQSVTEFFTSDFPRPFEIYIHPDRKSLDMTWQTDWNLPDFVSECWMVASGVANKLDLMSPVQWDELACDHDYTDKIATQKLITHELVHVFHGQNNPSPDFSNVTDIDWFVEGLAVFVSGQCDSLRMEKVKEAVFAGKAPEKLKDLWTGNNKYGLAGSAVMYINEKWGQKKVADLMKYTTMEEVLSALDTTEEKLMADWKSYIKSK